MNGEELGRLEHYRLIRTDASYRNFLMLEEMQAEMQPSLSSSLNVPEPLKEREQWSPRQWDVVNQLRAEIKHLSNKVVELSKPKVKSSSGNPFRREA